VNPLDPNIQLVEMIAKALDTLCEELLFVGGCAAGLLCTSQTAAPARVTYDVDVVAEVAALSGYHALEKQFSARGFVRDISEDAPICRSCQKMGSETNFYFHQSLRLVDRFLMNNLQGLA